jgi:hypothetical protein
MKKKQEENYLTFFEIGLPMVCSLFQYRRPATLFCAPKTSLRKGEPPHIDNEYTLRIQNLTLRENYAHLFILRHSPSFFKQKCHAS